MTQTIAEPQSLYTIDDCHQPYSVLKSAFVTNQVTYDNTPIINIEPYDETGEKYLDGSNSQYDHAIEIIEKCLQKHPELTSSNNTIYITVNSNRYDRFDFIYDTKNNKEY